MSQDTATERAPDGVPAELVNVTANYYVYETREPNKRPEIYYLRRTRFKGHPPVRITLPELPRFR